MNNLEMVKMLSKVGFYDDVVGAKDSIPLKNIALALDLPSDDTQAIIDILKHKKIINYKCEPDEIFVDMGYFRRVSTTWELHGTINTTIMTIVLKDGINFIDRVIADEDWQSD